MINRPPSLAAKTPEEIVVELGEQLKALRLMRNISQTVLAGRAGVSVSALKGLENGRGATIKTLVRVVQALGRQEWFAGIAPMPSINPLALVRHAAPRQRARRRGVQIGSSPAKRAG